MKPLARGALCCSSDIKALAIVFNAHEQLGCGIAGLHGDGLCVGVFECVGQALLHNAQHRKLVLRAQWQVVTQGLCFPMQRDTSGFESWLHAKPQIAQGQQQ